MSRINTYISPSSDKYFKKAIRNLFGFRPRNVHLYRLAMCHKAGPTKYNGDTELNNERLEYLGDAVLSSVVADYLYKKFPTKDEGFLTEMRSKIVSRSRLNQLSRKMGIDRMIFEEKEVRTKSKSIFGDTFEALIGAIYLDKGYKVARKIIIHRIVDVHLDIDKIEHTESNFKSRLIEWVQKEKKTIDFHLVEEIGDGYGKQYKVEVLIDKQPFGKAQDFSIKAAEQRAAELTCEMIFNGEEE